MNIRTKYEHFYDWNIHRREHPVSVAKWLTEFIQWRQDYYSLVGNHPGYLIKLTRSYFYDWTPDCWVTAWCQENILPLEDGTPAFALVTHVDTIVVIPGYDNKDEVEVIRLLFDREADAALFKLSFMDKITPKISTRENSCNT